MSNSLGSVAEGMTDETLAQQQVQLNAQAIQGGTLKIQDMRIGLARDKISLAQQMKMMQLMNNLHFGEAGEQGQGQSPNPSPDEMAGFVNDLALIQAESGNPEQAAATASKAADIASKGADVQYKQYQMQAKRLTTFANILDSVPDTAQGYQQALQTMVQEDPRVVKDAAFQRLAKQPWRPGLITQIKSSVVSAKDKSLEAYRKFEEQHSQNIQRLEEQRLELEKVKVKAQEERDKAIGKDGVKPPTADQLRMITDQATVDFPGADPATLRTRSRSVVDDMIGLVKKEKLTWAQAATKAYHQAKKDGVYAGLRGFKGMLGSSKNNPLPLPADASKVMNNQWYVVKGEPMVALDGKFYSQEDLDQMDQENEAMNDE